MSRPAKSSQPPVVASRLRLLVLPSILDVALFVAIFAITIPIVSSAGSRRGVELMPWPDGLEYAAAAVNLESGRGPVLHFGGYTYPSRYSAGYPLILDNLYRSRVGYVWALYIASLFIGALSVTAVFSLANLAFGRAAAIAGALLLALSPVFITYSSLVMSDAPTLLVTITAAFTMVTAASDDAHQSQVLLRMLLWSLFGLLAGFSTIIRPTNATIFAGLALCVVMVPLQHRDRSSLLKAAIAIAIGFAIPVAWQLHQNAIHLGSAFASGYAWWVPEVYGASGKTFSAAYLFGPTMPRNPHGNVPIYALTLLGLDGMLGARVGARYFLYPSAAGAFAIIGFLTILRAPERPAARRLMWFGLGYLAALTGLYCFYLFTDPVFILPAAFVLFIAAGAGVAAANREARDAFRNHRSAGAFMTAACVIVLDVLLIISLGSEVAIRLSARPAESVMVPTLQSADSTFPPNAIVVSNISLQFLELYLPAENRRFVGLNSLDPGETFTDYHLHRLYEKRAAGWNGAIPPVVFDGAAMSAEADSLVSAIGAKTPVFLLIAVPESQQYADVLKGEFDNLQSKFGIEPVAQNRVAALYRLTIK